MATVCAFILRTGAGAGGAAATQSQTTGHANQRVRRHVVAPCARRQRVARVLQWRRAAALLARSDARRCLLIRDSRHGRRGVEEAGVVADNKPWPGELWDGGQAQQCQASTLIHDARDLAGGGGPTPLISPESVRARALERRQTWAGPERHGHSERPAEAPAVRHTHRTQAALFPQHWRHHI